MRRFDLDLLSDENLEPRRSTMELIAFGHASKPTIGSVGRRFIGVRSWLGIAFAVVAATATAIGISGSHSAGRPARVRA